MKRKWLWMGLGFVLAMGILVGLSLRKPSSELTRSLRFLDGFAATGSAYKDQHYTYSGPSGDRREVFALVEEFDFPKSFQEVCEMARRELKARAFHTNFNPRGNPPTMLYSVLDPQNRWSSVVTITGCGPANTTVRFVTNATPSGPVDRFLAWVRRLLGR